MEGLPQCRGQEIEEISFQKGQMHQAAERFVFSHKAWFPLRHTWEITTSLFWRKDDEKGGRLLRSVSEYSHFWNGNPVTRKAIPY